jgi:protein-disulfide isomerase
MKKTLVITATLLLSITSGLFAAPAGDLQAIRKYARRNAVQCDDLLVTVTALPSGGPANFTAYDVVAKSASDDSCNGHKNILYSPTTQQVIAGVVLPLAQDNRPVTTRLQEMATQALKKDVTVTVSPFPLPDGLKAAQITRSTEYGAFVYDALVDASEKFMIIGVRGDIKTDPGKTIRDVLRTSELAVRRGNPKAKLEILEFSDFECPTCANMHKKLESLIQKNLSRINYGRMDFPLFDHHEWAMAAALGGMAVEKTAPAKYWNYVDYIFTNQESIGKMPFDKVLQNFCEDNDIPLARVMAVYRSPTERQNLLTSVGRMFDSGLNSTPTFMINGEIIGFGKEGIGVINAIKAAIAK